MPSISIPFPVPAGARETATVVKVTGKETRDREDSDG
jgi:hypothetical protein